MIFPYRSIAYESAGIIARYSDEATTTESLKVFSFATGTKCVGVDEKDAYAL
jgi:hypothetical protein